MLEREFKNLKKMLIKKPELLKYDDFMPFLDRWIGICDLEYTDNLRKDLELLEEIE